MDGSTPSRVAIIGAGPAGITTAYQLTKAGIGVDVFEAGPDVGGLSRTITLWNQKVDLGPHRFFSSDSRINRLWLEVIGRDYEMVNRLTRIYYKGKFFHYPLRPLDAFFKLGPKEVARCLVSFVKEGCKSTKASGSFEDWVVSRFGRRLFEIFFKTYSEKLWGITCRELDSDFAAQRIKKLSLVEAVKNAFFKTNSRKHKTLVDQFAYPHGGSGVLYQRMAEYIEAHGGTLQRNRPVYRVTVDNRQVTGLEFEDGETRSFARVVSTMPLNLLVERLPETPSAIKEAAQALRFRNTILVYLKVEAQNLFADNWLYVHSPDLKVGRITNFRNWVPQLYGKEASTVLALEYWCNSDETIWQEDDASLIALATRELATTGLIGEARVADGYIHRIPRCYPVYARGYKELLKPVERYLDSIAGLTVIGRYGSFKYNNQDHSILMAMLAAENIAQDRHHDLWAVNTDYEQYQEASLVTQTGLVQRKRKQVPSPAGAAAQVLQRA